MAEKEKKIVFSKDIVVKNQVFELNQIEDFFSLFNLYCDNRRQCDVKDIVSTARTLGYEKTHKLVYDGLVQICDELDNEWIGFEQFLTMLTEKLVIYLALYRVIPLMNKAEDKYST